MAAPDVQTMNINTDNARDASLNNLDEEDCAYLLKSLGILLTLNVNLNIYPIAHINFFLNKSMTYANFCLRLRGKIFSRTFFFRQLITFHLNIFEWY